MRPLYVVAGWLLFGAVQGILTLVTRHLPASELRWALPFGLLVGLSWALLTPGIVWFTRRVTAAQRGLFVAILAHTAAAILAAGLAAGARWGLIELLAPTDAVFALYFFYWLDLHVVLYLIVAGLARTLELRREVQGRTRKTLDLQAQLARARLQFLQRQLQPHFLFNALNAVSELAWEAPDAAVRMLRRLQQLLRAAISRADIDLVPLREELATLEPFIEIQRMRFSDRLAVERRIDPAALEALVPTLILQPLVENAIQHGLASREGGIVRIEARVADGRLHISVRDNGAGMAQRVSPWGQPTAAATHGAATRTGVGLRNTRTRLAQIFGESHRFELRDAGGGGAVVEIDIPCRTVPAEEPFVLHTGEHAVALPLADPDGGPNGSGAIAMAAARGDGDDALSRTLETTTEDTPIIWRAVAARPPKLSPRTWAALAAVWGLFALFWTNQIYLYRLAYREAADALPPPESWINWADLVSAGIWAAFTPLVVWLARRLPVTRQRLRARLAIHLVIALVLDATHIGIIWRSGFLGELPLISPNILSPLLLNLLIYAALIVWSHGRDFYAWYREREAARTRLEAAIARAQWRMLCVELRPEWILTTLDAIAERIRHDAAAAERLVVRLADVLRVTLVAAREPATTLGREVDRLTSYVDIVRETHEADIRLTVRAAPESLGVSVPSGLMRALLEHLLAPEAIVRGGTLVLALDARLEDAGLLLMVSSSAPLAGAGSADDVAWQRAVESAAVPHGGAGLSIDFPDPRSAIVRLDPGTAVADGALVSDPLLTAAPT